MVVDVDIDEDLKAMEEVDKKERALTKNKNKYWRNSDNNEFYEAISIDTFITNSILGGLEEGGDLDLISDYIINATSILEVGAGYGRVLNYLIKHNFSGKIAALERSKKYANLLNKKFSAKVKIFNTDLFKFHTNNKYDLILWMFSGISDYAKEEQLLALAQLANYLTKNGKIVLDTFSHSIKPANAVTAESQSYIITVDHKTLYGYIPSPKEIDYYAESLGFNNTRHLPYETITNSKRMLHILSYE